MINDKLISCEGNCYIRFDVIGICYVLVTLSGVTWKRSTGAHCPESSQGRVEQLGNLK